MPLENAGRIISITKKKEKVKISFSTFDTIELSYDQFTDDYYYVGKDILKKEYDKLVSNLKDDKNLKYAISICSKKFYTKKEIIDKLKSKGADKKSIERIVKKLKEYKLIDDSQYVIDFKNLHDQKLDGKIKIINSLKEKGISEILIKELYFDYDLELEKAKKLAPSLLLKFNNKSKSKIKEAFISSLVRKGYTYDIALLCYESISDNIVNEDEEKIKKAVLLLKSKGYEKEYIIKKLLARGYRYNDIKKVVGD